MRRFLISSPVLFALSLLASSASAGEWPADRSRDDFVQPAAASEFALVPAGDNLAGQQTAWAGNYPASYGYPVSTYPTSTYPVSTYPASSYPYGNQASNCPTCNQCPTCPNPSAAVRYPYSTVNGTNCNGGFCGTSNAYRYPTGYNPYAYNTYNTRPAYRGGLFGLGLFGR